MRNILITGGAGFIGANFVYYWLRENPEDHIVVLDALTYSGVKLSIEPLIQQEQLIFVHGDICDKTLIITLFEKHQIDTVVHFAAESHVDRSILTPDEFIRTNIQGTQTLLGTALESWRDNIEGKRFHHISTDEVYGDLGLHDPAFTEQHPYAPRSPYAASKAASDMMVRVYNHTYGLPVSISNCSNNYGPYQFPEKLIPLMLINILMGKPLPVYGDGSHIRDWLYVEDHCRAIGAILESGRTGETYNIGGDNQIQNLELVQELCRLIDMSFDADDALASRFPDCPYVHGNASESLIRFVKDRPGHDRRYAINTKKISTELSFHPHVDFSSGLGLTLDWYLNNETWWQTLMSGELNDWFKTQYGQTNK